MARWEFNEAVENSPIKKGYDTYFRDPLAAQTRDGLMMLLGSGALKGAAVVGIGLVVAGAVMMSGLAAAGMVTIAATGQSVGMLSGLGYGAVTAVNFLTSGLGLAALGIGAAAGGAASWKSQQDETNAAMEAALARAAERERKLEEEKQKAIVNCHKPDLDPPAPPASGMTTGDPAKDEAIRQRYNIPKRKSPEEMLAPPSELTDPNLGSARA